MSDPKSPPVDTTSAPPLAEAAGGAVESVQPAPAEPEFADPHTALAAAEPVKAEPVEVQPKRFVPPRNPLEVISSVDLKPRGMFSFLRNKIFIFTVLLPTLIQRHLLRPDRLRRLHL